MEPSLSRSTSEAGLTSEGQGQLQGPGPAGLGRPHGKLARTVAPVSIHRAQIQMCPIPLYAWREKQVPGYMCTAWGGVSVSTVLTAWREGRWGPWPPPVPHWKPCWDTGCC